MYNSHSFTPYRLVKSNVLYNDPSLASEPVSGLTKIASKFGLVQ